MNRYRLESSSFVKDDPDGEWIRYTDHCEAMKRIAGDGAQQAEPVALTDDALIDAANARAELYEGDDRPCIKTDVMNAFYAGAEFARRATLSKAAPSASAQAGLVAWGAFRVGGDRDGQLYAFCKTQHEIETYITQVHQSSDSVTLRDAPLYAAPPVARASAQHAEPAVVRKTFVFDGVRNPDFVPLRIEFEPGYPEDVAFGTQRQMDRLKKWLDKFFAMRTAQSASPADQDEQAQADAGAVANHKKVIAALNASVAVGSDGQWVSIRRAARDDAVMAIRNLHSDAKHMYESYSECASRASTSVRQDAKRYEFVLECEVTAAKKYLPDLDADAFKAKRRAAHDAAMSASKEGA